MKNFKIAVFYFIYLFLVWSLYRHLFVLPDEIEIAVVKPIVWILPILLILHSQGEGLRALGFSFKGLFSSLKASIILGVVFVILSLIVNYSKYSELNFLATFSGSSLLSAFLLSLISAFSEEVSYRGYILNRFQIFFKQDKISLLLVSAIATIVFATSRFFFDGSISSSIFVMSFLVFVFNLGNSILFLRHKNIFASILVNVLWQWPIILFR